MVPKYVALASGDAMVSTMYVSLKLIRRFTELRQEADKQFKLPQRQYEKDYDRNVRIALISPVSNYVYIDKPAASFCMQKFYCESL